MLLPIDKVLSDAEVESIQLAIANGSFQAGSSTAVGSAARVKNNLQLSGQSEAAVKANKILVAALRAHNAFQSATYIAAMTVPTFCRYEPGMNYGDHIDSPIMGGAPMLRTDISVTVSLTDAASYDGGELVIDVAGVPQRWKGNAGDCLLYPSDTLHRVESVTRGTRTVAIFWIQSLVRDPGERRILYDLSRVLDHVGRASPAEAHTELLRRSYMNLLRRWADPTTASPDTRPA
jgi:PKHD-type hydroxylase